MKMGTALTFGAAIGAGVGVALGHLALGVGFGVAAGAAFSTLTQHSRGRK